MYGWCWPTSVVTSKNFALALCLDALYRRKRRGLDFAQFPRQEFDRAITYVLTNYAAIRLHAEQHGAATVVQHGANGPRTFPTLAGSAF